jgi:hypothetical protein
LSNRSTTQVHNPTLCRFVINQGDADMYQPQFLVYDFSNHLCVRCHFPRIPQNRFDHITKIRKTTNPNARYTCMPCGELEAKAESKIKQSRVLPINKSTPTYISDLEMLKQLNPKRTT